MARILFIGVDYFDYAREICAALTRLGHEVRFEPIEDKRFASKAMKKLSAKAYSRRLAAKHAELVEETAGESYDVVLFVQVHQMARGSVERLRELHPEAEFILYNWDSLTTHDYRPWLEHFDYAATFDPDDARTLGIGHLPLFAIPRFFEIDHDRPKEHDLYFVGAIATRARFEALERLHAFCEKNGLSTRMHLYCTPPVRFGLMRDGKHLPGVTGKTLSFDGIVAMLESSRATFDFANHRQSGYTMRLIENMCAGRKIVTQNPRIVEEPFYRDDRFLLVDGHDFSRVPEFLARPIVSDLDLGAFHVDSWAANLLARRPVQLAEREAGSEIVGA